MVLSRRLALSGLAVSLAHVPAWGAEGRIEGLYQATAIVTGTDLRQRPTGFARCLREVLVKLTGMPQLIDDPAAAAVGERAETLVASYFYIDPRAAILHHDDQGTYDRSYELVVRFDPDKVDALLRSMGLRPWTGPRPLLNPVILVRDRSPTPFLLSSSAPQGSDMRQAVARVAGEFGMGVRFPTEADLAEWSVGLLGFPAPLTVPSPGLAQVTGTLSWTIQAMGWVGSWRMTLRDATHEWGIRGVGFDDAFVDVVRGAVMLVAGTGTP